VCVCGFRRYGKVLLPDMEDELKAIVAAVLPCHAAEKVRQTVAFSGSIRAGTLQCMCCRCFCMLLLLARNCTSTNERVSYAMQVVKRCALPPACLG
jgi:hypothetical protein